MVKMQLRSKVKACFVLIAVCMCKAFPTPKSTSSYTTFNGAEDAIAQLGIEHPLFGLRVLSIDEDESISFSNSVAATRNKRKATVKVSPLLLEENGQRFTVVWEGVKDPSEDDWIAVYLAESDPTVTAPVQYIHANVSQSHMSSGSGSARIPIISHRADLRVFFLKDNWGYKVALAASETIEMPNPHLPLRVHLALTGTPGEMLVHWVALPSMHPIVKWGLVDGANLDEAQAQGTTYQRNEMCGSPANSSGYIDPGMLFSAVMTGLVPGETYRYIVGDEFGYSKRYTFKAPGGGSKLKIAAVGDMGQAPPVPTHDPHDLPSSLKTSERIGNEEDLDLILHIGDISYAMGYVSDWDVFLDQWGDVIAQVPYMVSEGNHERDWPFTGDRYDVSYNSGGECGVAYERRFKMPRAGHDKPWYSFDMGPVHFLVFTGELDFDIGSEQYRFMEKDLQSVDRSITPWVVVAGHRPMYVSIEKDTYVTGYYHVSLELQAQLENLFMKYKVDMMWSGHHHSYHRSCPVYKQKCYLTSRNGNAMAPVHFVFGTAGANLYTNLAETPFREVAMSKYGYFRAEATASSFQMEFVSNEDGSVLDSYTLKKSPQWESERDGFWSEPTIFTQ